MTANDALKELAYRIWKHGERNDNSLCLVPSWVELGDYGEISDALHKTYKATHYSRIWHEKGKSVKIKLVQYDSFGASIGPFKEVFSAIIPVD